VRQADGMMLGMIFEPSFNYEILCVLAHKSTLASILG
jgi:hypothetical protein